MVGRASAFVRAALGAMGDKTGGECLARTATGTRIRGIAAGCFFLFGGLALWARRSPRGRVMP